MKTRIISKELFFLFLVTFFITISYGQKNVEQYNTNGLSTNIFNADAGKITVYLPFHSEGEQVSGTIKVEAIGNSKSQKMKNLSKMQNYHLIFGAQSLQVKAGHFALRSSGIINTSIQLINEKGRALAKSYTIKGREKKTKINTTQIPAYVVSGEPAKISSNCDGDLMNNSIRINDLNTTILAESESELFFETPSDLIGVNELKFTNGEDEVMTHVHVLSLQLSVEKMDLFRGETINLSIGVAGLKGLEYNVPLSITNTSPRNVTLEGGNYQELMIDPENDASSGTYQTMRSIKAKLNGAFLITVHIVPTEFTIFEK